jgi:hypothetical protein
VRGKRLIIVKNGENIFNGEGEFYKLDNEGLENYLINLAYEKKALNEGDKQEISEAKKIMKELELQD